MRLFSYTSFFVLLFSCWYGVGCQESKVISKQQAPSSLVAENDDESKEETQASQGFEAIDETLVSEQPEWGLDEVKEFWRPGLQWKLSEVWGDRAHHYHRIFSYKVLSTDQQGVTIERKCIEGDFSISGLLENDPIQLTWQEVLGVGYLSEAGKWAKSSYQPKAYRADVATKYFIEAPGLMSERLIDEVYTYHRFNIYEISCTSEQSGSETD